MKNPPFPYSVRITRDVASSDPFVDAKEPKTLVYDGVCDFENNRYPVYKDGVQVGKYKLYLPDNSTPVDIGDEIELNLLGRVIKGNAVDFTPTNFGLTITWDSSKN